MKKLGTRFVLVMWFLCGLIVTCSQNVSAWQGSQIGHFVESAYLIAPAASMANENVIDSNATRRGKVSLPFIKGPNFVCHTAVFEVKNSRGSYEWSSNQPDFLSIDKDGAVTIKQGVGGFITIRAKLWNMNDSTAYIDKTIEIPARFYIVISGDSILSESGKNSGIYKINFSGRKKGELIDTPAKQFEWGIKYSGGDPIHSISKSNENFVSADLVSKWVNDYFKQSTITSKVELVGRVQTQCGWSEWSQPLVVKILQKPNVVVYPNPARGKITVEFKSELGCLPDQVVIYGESDMRSVKTLQLNEGGLFEATYPSKINIDLADLKPGVYFLHFKSNHGIKIVRVLLN